MKRSRFAASLFLSATLAAQAPRLPSQAALTALYTAALHTFALVRSGTAIDDPATGIQHPASHLTDATPDGRDLTGGWYNAADFGKWTMTSAISVSYMLHLGALQQGQAHHPDPNLLAQAQWGLTWLLKMQDPDGGVRHKIDSGTYTALAAAWGHSPDQDPTVRIATPASTLDTADFAAILYQASRIFGATQPTLAASYRGAADRAYAWLQQHPATPAHDPFYADDDPAQELLWAHCEHALLHPGEAPGLAQRLATFTPEAVRWSDPSLLGLYSLATVSQAPQRLQTAARQAIRRAALQQAQAAARRPFRVTLGPKDYWWGSAERVLHDGALFLMADHLEPSSTLRQAGVDQLQWILGNNALHHSLVTGFGTRPVQHPYHWTTMALGKTMPGWVVAGPNASPDWADKPLLHLQQQGTPPEQCYLDLCSRDGSWASNEGEICEEAALVFVTGTLLLPIR